MHKLSLLIPVLIAYLLPLLADAATETASQPSKDGLRPSLISAWESFIKHDAGTKLFEKTDEPGIYKIDTTLIPYNGRIKLLNAVIDTYKPVGDYDKDIKYGGVVETELMDAAKDIAEVQPFSFKKWQAMGWFDYDQMSEEWFSFSQWDQHFPPEQRAPKKACPKTIAPNSDGSKLHSC